MGVDNLVKVTNQERPIATGKIQSEKERKKVSALFPRLSAGLTRWKQVFFFLFMQDENNVDTVTNYNVPL